MTSDQQQVSRRIVMGGAGGLATVAALAACSDDSGDSPATSAPPSAAQTSAGGGDTAAVSPNAPLAKTADVPVGGGIIVDGYVVTQPTAGTFVGLSTVCTHQGCQVSRVVDGEIECPCHRSMFDLQGAVVSGPAREPLPARPIRVDGDAIVPA